MYAYPHIPEEKRDVVDLDNHAPGADAELPRVQAMEFLADVWEVEAGVEAKKAPEEARAKIEKAGEVHWLRSLLLHRSSHRDQMWKSLDNEHNTIRKQ